MSTSTCLKLENEVKFVKKVSISSFIIVVLLMFVFTVSAFAITYDTSWAFNTGSNGTGKVDGSSNNIFYSLATGTAYLGLSDDYYCDQGSYTVKLCVPGVFGPYVVGYNTFYSGPIGSQYYHSGTYSVPDNRSDYFFVVTGTGIYTYYAASGTFSQ